MSYTVFEVVAEQNGSEVYRGISNTPTQAYYDLTNTDVDVTQGPITVTWRQIEVDEVAP